MKSLRWSPVESKSYYELPWLLLVVFFYKKLEINKKTNKRNYRGYPKIIQIGSNKFKDILRKWHEKLSSIKQWIWEIPPFQVTKKKYLYFPDILGDSRQKNIFENCSNWEIRQIFSSIKGSDFVRDIK